MGWPVLGYLLGKNFRRRDRNHLVPPGCSSLPCRDVLSFRSGAREASGSETPRFDNAARRRGRLRFARSSRSRRWLGKNWTRTIWSSSAPQLPVPPASGAMTTSKCSLMAALCPHHEGARGTGGLAVDVDAGLWLS